MATPGPSSARVRPGLLLRARCRDDLVRQLAWDLFVMRELRAVYAATLSKRTQVRGILVGLGLRDVGADHLVVAVRLGAEDLPAARRQVAHHVTQEFLRHPHLDL